MHRCFTKHCISDAALAMERNLTQREYEELNSRREAAGRPPLSYRDANRQARQPTTRQRQARQQGVGIEGSGTEVSSEARARPPTPPRPKRQRDERGSSSQTYTWTGDWWGQDWGAWSWQDTHWWEHQDSAAAATAANQPEMEAQQTDTVQDAVWQLDQMEISTDEEECSLETTTPAATGTMEGGVRIDPTDLFDVPLTMSDLPEDSSKAEKLSKMMTAALRHKPGSHVRRRWLLTAPSMDLELHPAQFLFSFLTARGLKNQLSLHGDVLTDDNNQIWHGVRVTESQDQGTASASAGGSHAMYHGTHLFALASVVKTGMRASSSQDGTRTLHKGGALLEGVYSMTKITQVLYYCPYVLVPLRAEGRADSIAAVRVVVELAAEPSSNQRLGKRTNQWILNERLVSIKKIWGQARSPDHLTPGDAYTNWDSKLEASL